ncbi:unnamed protein product [Microthlaspi erraticum]|uniref:Reverse transcriptase domain-containing protein n=1 Tax=Microthlaspi erraticum TaxID=1685480 RepID=A0A6D2JLA4_9BRAS|nr:unnamed protein product [Microthlaspi erraticum]
MVMGDFKGKRGLRQGDPLFPYLFVIAMNCLSTMLNKAAEKGKFNYHDKCSATKLTHICFADDLLISVEEIEIFASGLSQQDCDLISFSTGIPQGTLPVHYLGVPLCTKKLSMSKCEVLIHQVNTRITSWSAKSLSFAGRLVLIKTVIAGISTFRCSTFILPKACIRRINSLYSFYLSKGNLEGHHSARVSWALIKKPKEAGCLEIKDLSTWNRACCLKLIWLLFFQSGSVWVAWFIREILEGNVSNLWTIKPHRENSWLANKLIKI